MLGLPRPFLHRALCGALLVTSAACSGGNVVFDAERRDSGTDPSTATDAGDNGGSNGNNGNGNGNNGDNNNGNNGPDVMDAGTTPIDAGFDAGVTPGVDATVPPHPLAGKYAVRTVIYARQKAEAAGTQLDLISEGTLLSVVDVSDTGLATEHYCFIETANSGGIASWTLPAATENIPNSAVQLTRVGDEYVRDQAGDLTYVSWSPVGQPADCVEGQTHSTGCLCGDADGLPVDAKDCRVLDLDADGKPGGTLFVGAARPANPSDGDNLVQLSIVGNKAIEWRIAAGQTGSSIKGAIAGGIDQSEVGRTRGSKPPQDDDSLLNLFSRIRNSICPGSYGHVELVRGNFTCESLLAARTEADLDSYGVFNTALDSDLGQKLDAEGQPLPVDTSVCPDPDACAEGVEKDACGVCDGPGFPEDTCDCEGTPPATWYGDADGDGLGDPAVTQRACMKPDGYVDNATDTDVDCKTTRDACGVCGGLVTPEDKCTCNGGTRPVWYDDTDGDGAGNPAITKAACTKPAGFVATANDQCPSDRAKQVPGVCGCAKAETNSDGDTLLDCVDNCPNVSNQDQADFNNDKQGDVCDDSDGDSVPDATDNCRTVSNNAQTNTDRANDGGDACDTDDDNDGDLDTADNCPLIANADQLNTDGDAFGDACDTDDDNDGDLDAADNCPLAPNGDQLNTDGDGLGNVCDLDDDNDGDLDGADNCQLVSNADQLNTDGDAFGNVCDTDDDNDGDLDTADNCPLIANPDQANSDGANDGGNACDADDDNDGTADASDQCPVNAPKTAPGACGCAVADTNGDGDAQADCNETCDADPAKIAPGICGCGLADIDRDGNGSVNASDCTDSCPNDPAKFVPGVCGCGVPDTNGDGDSQLDCKETCDADPAKTAPGVCGCGISDVDRTGDGVVNANDCTDACPSDPAKFLPGLCGCGVADTDSDGDGTPNCNDLCPNNGPKTAPGACGCATADTNSDGDTLANCVDNCPNITNQNQADFNTDGQGDLCDDSDGDSVLDATDNCRTVSNNTQVNTDGAADGGDACDTDDDNDGDLDTADNCPLVSNADQLNTDGDATGNLCDTDDDNDGDLDTADNCALVSNADQLNTDGDAFGNACDPDDDNDGTADASDGCPVNAPKTAPGLCGCAVAEGSCSNANPLLGTYAVRNILYTKGRSGTNTSGSKVVNYSLVTITDNGNGTLKLSDKSCYTETLPESGSIDVYSWSKPSWIAKLPTAERTLVNNGDGTWTRQPQQADLGWSPSKQPSNCTTSGTTITPPGGSTTCRCNLPTASIPPFSKTSPADCRAVDEDLDGSPGISVFLSTTPPASPEANAGGLSWGRLMIASRASNTWKVTPAADGRHTGTITESSSSTIIGCAGGGLANACGQVSANPINNVCPQQFNKVWFVPAAANSDTCGEIVTNRATVFPSGQDGTLPTDAQCAPPP